MKIILLVILLIAFLQSVMAQQTEIDLKNIFAEHIEKENAGSGVVMVEVSAKGTRFINYGKIGIESTAPNADD